jgi:hypothetical protein
MAARKIGELLAGSGQLKILSREAQRLAELEGLIFEAAPRALSEATRISGFRGGTLILCADNAAIAAKLRQLIPRLLVCVRKRDPEVSGIRVEVQPGPGRRRSPQQSERRRLTPTAVANFRSLAEGLGDSPLKDAVNRLVWRHKKQ